MPSITCPECKHRFDPTEQASTSRLSRDNPVKLMWECKALSDDGMTGTEIARRVGRNQPHVSKLLLIAGRVHASVLKRWAESWERSDDAHVPIAAMRELGVEAQELRMREREQLARYDHLLAKAKLAKKQHREKHTLPRRRI